MRLSRRQFLKTVERALSLPLLESHAFAKDSVPPRRMVVFMSNMGVMPRYFFHRIPLANLFVAMLQRLSVETDHFSSSIGTMSGLQI